jgi:hypothetical protein
LKAHSLSAEIEGENLLSGKIFLNQIDDEALWLLSLSQTIHYPYRLKMSKYFAGLFCPPWGLPQHHQAMIPINR